LNFLPVHFGFGHHGALVSECSHKIGTARPAQSTLHLAPDEHQLLRNHSLRVRERDDYLFPAAAISALWLYQKSNQLARKNSAYFDFYWINW